jgi:hypothetical protein
MRDQVDDNVAEERGFELLSFLELLGRLARLSQHARPDGRQVMLKADNSGCPGSLFARATLLQNTGSTLSSFDRSSSQIARSASTVALASRLDGSVPTHFRYTPCIVMSSSTGGCEPLVPRLRGSSAQLAGARCDRIGSVGERRGGFPDQGGIFPDCRFKFPARPQKFPVRVRRELARKALVLCAFLLRLTHSRASNR